MSEALSPASDLTESSPEIMIPGIAEDGSLYPIEKLAAHRQKTLHLAISVFVFDQGKLLIQQRAHSKYHCGGLWANTCCTHPHWGETVEHAAERRLQEELGFTMGLTPTRVVEYAADVGGGLWEHERVHMFRADTDSSSLLIKPNPEEVAATRWVDAETLHREISKTPEAFTPWFQIYVKRFPDLEF